MEKVPYNSLLEKILATYENGTRRGLKELIDKIHTEIVTGIPNAQLTSYIGNVAMVGSEMIDYKRHTSTLRRAGMDEEDARKVVRIMTMASQQQPSDMYTPRVKRRGSGWTPG